MSMKIKVMEEVMKLALKPRWVLIGALLAGVILSLCLVTCDDSVGVPKKYKVFVVENFYGFIFCENADEKLLFEKGKTVKLIIAPKQDYKLSVLTVKDAKLNEIDLNPPTVSASVINYSFKMPASNVRVEAEFITGTPYNINMGSMTGGSFVSDPPNSQYEGMLVMLTAQPGTDKAYQQGTLTVTRASSGFVTVTPMPGQTNQWTFIMPGESVTVSAHFYDTTNPPQDYAITISVVGDGTVTSSPANKAQENSEVILTATPDEGKQVGTITVTGNSGGSVALTPVDGQSNQWRFFMPSERVTVNATFSAATYNINISSKTGGSVTSDPPLTTAAMGTPITLVVASNEGWKYTEGSLTVTGASGSVTITPVPGQSNKWTFLMPGESVTVTAAFEITEPLKNGVKTLTVLGGLGRKMTSPDKSYMTDGTRHISVTVTLTNDVITNVALDHDLVYFPENCADSANFRFFLLEQLGGNVFVTAANSLATAIKNSNNPRTPFSPPGNLPDHGKAGWPKHEEAIRKAVEDAVAAIRGGKPNGVLAGGHSATSPFTIDGAPLSGEATLTGMSYMEGTEKPFLSGSLPTDISVKVTVADGFINDLLIFDAGELNCVDQRFGMTVQTRVYVNVIWPNEIKNKNTWNLDAVSGATVTNHAIRNMVKKAVEKIAYEGE
jgi:hypothetical protein